MRQASFFTALALPLALAACNASMPRPVAVATPATPSIVDNALAGTWRSGDGIAVSTFNNGVFQSQLAENGTVVARGRYVPVGPSQYKVDWYSVRAKSNTSATCSLTGPSALFCTQDNGTTFELTRAA